MPGISFPPYAGTSRKLVLAIDVGTTFSGVSYAILDPGEVPTIQNVNRFPGQTVGDYKVPSILLYTQEGKMHAVGAEADNSSTMSVAEREKLVLVEWFKLHLRPESMAEQEDAEFKMKPLPEGKSVAEVFGDFLWYLFDCTRTLIEQSHASGESMWNSVKDDFDVVLSHPNGWEGVEQTEMRKAAVYAGLIPEVSSTRLRFVTEGEACVNYCVYYELAKNVMQDNTSILVIDAGGGTIDLSAYHVATLSPASLEEIAPAICLLQGSTTLNMRFEKALRKRLQNSKRSKDADISSVLKFFDQSVKPTFKEKCYIPFGTVHGEDGSIGLKNGQMEFSKTAISQLFDPTIAAVVDAVRSINKESSKKITLVFFVGGFAASTFLFTQLNNRLKNDGLDLFRPDTHMNKAVAEGAMVYYLGHLVTARVARLTIGTVCGVDFDEANEEHVKRKDQAKHRPSGVLTVPGKFVPLALRGTSLAEDDVVFRSMCKERKESNAEGNVEAPIIAYHGTKKHPGWVDEEPDLFVTLCTISADTSAVEPIPRTGNDGKYFIQPFDVVLECGKTEWSAYLRWNHEDTEKRGTAKIAYLEGPSGQ